MPIDPDTVWRRIVHHSGQECRQIRGKPFTYRARGRTIYLDTTNRMISRTAIEKALTRVPLRSTSDVQDLSAPSYIYAILMDKRIRQSDWA
ncbi:MAG: hypothetical protein QY307_07345 [Acidimicrobiia bacterium]|nr:MAG: hypothetical protein QY307_07345 [Acidimicrobiia bacterium]